MMKIEKTQLLSALKTGLQSMDLVISESIQSNIIDYLLLLQKWNAVHNLTAIRDPLEMISRHVLDSLVLLPFVTKMPGNLIDVGTGAGIPGLLLALCLPEQKVFLLDSNQKKINFVQHVILSLKLSNATAICDRVERFLPQEPFDWVVSRAFASLSEFVRLSRHLCKNGGRFLAMKGAVEPSELASVQEQTGAHVERLESVTVPGVAGARSLVFMTIDEI